MRPSGKILKYDSDFDHAVWFKWPISVYQDGIEIENLAGTILKHTAFSVSFSPEKKYLKRNFQF